MFRGAKPKAAEKSWWWALRVEIEATLASPVFGQTRSIGFAVGAVWSAERRESK
ncbi:hypothetical protein [Agrobacterium vitis]|uniref:Uncharacterized protein n=1 Tax=Agrobacterium vitis TaxID=373 RepID=A0A7K1RKG0_AGRVI|nr:hypothetical protein [Agrobacterium vitis]MVA58477.1 hypothetical protein [Agrobacterium vitis]